MAVSIPQLLRAGYDYFKLTAFDIQIEEERE